MGFNLFGKKKKKDEPAKQVDSSVPAEAKKSAPAVTSMPVTGPSVVRRMHVSEKSSLGAVMGQYTFIVDPSATKPEVAKAVQTRYKVKVKSVKMVTLPSKTRRIGRYLGAKSGVKKAVVVLQKGDTISTS